MLHFLKWHLLADIILQWLRPAFSACSAVPKQHEAGNKKSSMDVHIEQTYAKLSGGSAAACACGLSDKAVTLLAYKAQYLITSLNHIKNDQNKNHEQCPTA